MTKLRVVPFRVLKRVLEKEGFICTSSRGSHFKFERPDGHIIVLPNHGSEPLGRGLIREILNQIGMDVESYNRILDKL